MNASRLQRWGFSLVELLVVLAIIAVLAALLMPALSATRIRAKTAACANNERHIGVAFASYVGDNNGYYPYEMPWPTASYCARYAGTYAYFEVLAPYLGFSTNGLPSGCVLNSQYVAQMACPANPWTYKGSHYGTGYFMNTSGFPIDFYGNYGTWGAPRVWCTNGTGAVDTPRDSTGSWCKRVNLNDIDHPAGLMLLGEQPYCPGNTMIGAYLTASPLPAVGGLSFCQVTNLASFASGNCYPAGDVNGQWLRPDCTLNIAAFHGQGMNVLYPDGHVSWIAKNTLIRYSLDIVGKYRDGEKGAPTAGWMFWDDLKNPTSGVNWFWSRMPGAAVN